MKNKGKFIVFEGIDGSGKTTQINLLSEWLKGKNISHVLTKEPGATILGDHLRELLTNEESIPVCPEAELLLFAANRVQHIEEIIAPALAQGSIVLCDRFSASTMAYQGYGRKINRGLVSQVNRISASGLVPDLTIYLDLEVQVALDRVAARGGRDSFDKENIVFHQRVRTGYLNSRYSFSNFMWVKANQPMEVVAKEVVKIVEEFLDEEDKY